MTENIIRLIPRTRRLPVLVQEKTIEVGDLVDTAGGIAIVNAIRQSGGGRRLKAFLLSGIPENVFIDTPLNACKEVSAFRRTGDEIRDMMRRLTGVWCTERASNEPCVVTGTDIDLITKRWIVTIEFTDARPRPVAWLPLKVIRFTDELGDS